MPEIKLPPQVLTRHIIGLKQHNKIIELYQRSHPGKYVALIDCPDDSSDFECIRINANSDTDAIAHLQFMFASQNTTHEEPDMASICPRCHLFETPCECDEFNYEYDYEDDYHDD